MVKRSPLGPLKQPVAELMSALSGKRTFVDHDQLRHIDTVKLDFKVVACFIELGVER